MVGKIFLIFIEKKNICKENRMNPNIQSKFRINLQDFASQIGHSWMNWNYSNDVDINFPIISYRSNLNVVNLECEINITSKCSVISRKRRRIKKKTFETFAVASMRRQKFNNAVLLIIATNHRSPLSRKQSFWLCSESSNLTVNIWKVLLPENELNFKFPINTFQSADQINLL